MPNTISWRSKMETIILCHQSLQNPMQQRKRGTDQTRLTKSWHMAVLSARRKEPRPSPTDPHRFLLVVQPQMEGCDGYSSSLTHSLTLAKLSQTNCGLAMGMQRDFICKGNPHSQVKPNSYSPIGAINMKNQFRHYVHW